MSFEEIRPIFGRVEGEWTASPPQTSSSPSFLYYVRGSGDDRSTLRVIATDFKSNTYHAVRSSQQLDDLRDDVGIGGLWSEFVDYVATSLKSGDVKLVMEGVSESGGASRAKLSFQKAKGMPRILFSLDKLVNGTAGEAMASLSLELYNQFKDVQSSLEEATFAALNFAPVNISTRNTAQEKSNDLQKQLNMTLFSGRHKSQKLNDRKAPDSTSGMALHESPDKQTGKDTNSRKGANRVVPAFRRSRVRGAILDDTEDDA